MDRTIMVLPGTEWQVPLIRKIKETGHRVVVVNPATDSPGFKFADAGIRRNGKADMRKEEQGFYRVARGISFRSVIQRISGLSVRGRGKDGAVRQYGQAQRRLYQR